MAIVDHEAELEKAGANVSGRFSSLMYFIRIYPLGAVGALIVLIFVIMAFFADFITAFDPTTTNSAASLAEPGSLHVRKSAGTGLGRAHRALQEDAASELLPEEGGAQMNLLSLIK